MTSHGCWGVRGTGGDVTTDYAKSTAVFCEGRWGPKRYEAEISSTMKILRVSYKEVNVIDVKILICVLTLKTYVKVHMILKNKLKRHYL